MHVGVAIVARVTIALSHEHSFFHLLNLISQHKHRRWLVALYKPFVASMPLLGWRSFVQDSNSLCRFKLIVSMWWSSSEIRPETRKNYFLANLFSVRFKLNNIISWALICSSFFETGLHSCSLFTTKATAFLQAAVSIGNEKYQVLNDKNDQ